MTHTANAHDKPATKKKGAAPAKKTVHEAHAGKQELVTKQKHEQARLRAGGKSGISSRFGKPDIHDPSKTGANDRHEHNGKSGSEPSHSGAQKERVDGKVREAVHNYIKAHSNDSIGGPAAGKAPYETKIPPTATQILRDWGVRGSNAELEKRAQEIIKHCARNGESGEQVLRHIANRIALYNSLPPTLRKELTGSSDAIDPRQIEGQMHNGVLGSSDHKFLLEGPPKGKSLEQKLSDKLHDTQQRLKELERTRHNLEALRKSQIAGLAQQVKQGDTQVQPLAIENLAKIDKMIEDNRRSLAAARQREELLTLSNQAYQHEKYINAGDRKNADLVALNMLKDHGALVVRQLCPSVWMELTERSGGPQGRTALERLHDAGLTQFTKLSDIGKTNADDPKDDQERKKLERALNANLVLRREMWTDLQQAQAAGDNSREDKDRQTITQIDEWIKKIREQLSKLPDNDEQRFQNALSALKDKIDPKFGQADVDEHRIDALRVIDGDPKLHALQDASAVLNQNLMDLLNMAQAGAQGTKSKEFVDAVREKARKVQEALSKVTPRELEQVHQRLNQMKAALAGMTDEKSKTELQNRINAMEQVVKVLDPNSEQRRQINDLCNTVRNRDFDADTWSKWLYSKGPALVAAIAAAAAATALVVTTMGAASPLAVMMVSAAAGTAGWMVGGEATRQGLYWVNHNLGDTGLGTYNEQSKVGDWLATPYEQRNVWKQVLGPYASEFAINTALAMATMGVLKGTVVTRALAGDAAAVTELRQLCTSRAFQQLGSQMERAAAVASENPAAGAFLKEWMKHAGSMAGFTAGQETMEALAKKAGMSSSWMSFGITIGLAMAHAHVDANQAKDMVHVGADGKVQVDPRLFDDAVREARQQGCEVKKLPDGSVEVRPYDLPPGEKPFVLCRGSQSYEGVPPREFDPRKYAAREPNPKLAEQSRYKWLIDSAQQLMKGESLKCYQEAEGYARREQKAGHLEVQTKPVVIKAVDLAGDTDMSATLKHLQEVQRESGVEPTPGGGARMKEARTLIELPSGKYVDIVNPGKYVDPHNPTKPVGDVTGADKETMDRIVNSEQGKRIIAEHAMTMMEEAFHAQQIRTGKPISDIFSRFKGNPPAYSAAYNKATAEFKEQYKREHPGSEGPSQAELAQHDRELELVFALHDAGLPTELIRQHYEGLHPGRNAAVDYLVRRDAAEKILLSDKTKYLQEHGLHSREDLERYADVVASLPVKPLRFLGGGQEQVAILLEDGRVLKLTDYEPDFDEIKGRGLDAPVRAHGERRVGGKNVTYYIQPECETPVSRDDADRFYEKCQRKGWLFRDSAGRDGGAGQLGYYYYKDPDSGKMKRRVVLLDPMAVERDN